MVPAAFSLIHDSAPGVPLPDNGPRPGSALDGEAACGTRTDTCRIVRFLATPMHTYAHRCARLEP